MIDQSNQPTVELTQDQQTPDLFVSKKYLLIILLVFLVFLLIGGWWFLGKLDKDTRYELSNESSLIQSPVPESSELPILQKIPSVKNLEAGTHVFQSFNNCGPASLSMALSHYGVNVSQKELGQALRPYQNVQGDNDDKSVTLSELAAKAGEYDFVVFHRPAGTMELVEKLIAQDLPVITRTWLKSNEDIGHYRVITGYNQEARQLIQDDSLQGKQLNYSYDEFENLWQAFNYEFLVLVPKDKVKIVEMILGDLNSESLAWQKALTLAEEQLKKDSSDIYAQFNKAVSLYHLERYQESIIAYESVADRLPSRMLWYQLEPVMAYFKNDDFETVIAMADKIINRENRAYSELYYLKGLIYREQGPEDLAEDNFTKAKIYNNSDFWKVNIL